MNKSIKIVIGCDLAGYDWKISFLKIMKEKGYNITDIGCDSSEKGEYTYYGNLLDKETMTEELLFVERGTELQSLLIR